MYNWDELYAYADLVQKICTAQLLSLRASIERDILQIN